MCQSGTYISVMWSLWVGGAGDGFIRIVCLNSSEDMSPNMFTINLIFLKAYITQFHVLEKSLHILEYLISCEIKTP